MKPDTEVPVHIEEGDDQPGNAQLPKRDSAHSSRHRKNLKYIEAQELKDANNEGVDRFIKETSPSYRQCRVRNVREARSLRRKSQVLDLQTKQTAVRINYEQRELRDQLRQWKLEQEKHTYQRLAHMAATAASSERKEAPKSATAGRPGGKKTKPPPRQVSLEYEDIDVDTITGALLKSSDGTSKPATRRQKTYVDPEKFLGKPENISSVRRAKKSIEQQQRDYAYNRLSAELEELKAHKERVDKEEQERAALAELASKRHYGTNVTNVTSYGPSGYNAAPAKHNIFRRSMPIIQALLRPKPSVRRSISLPHAPALGQDNSLHSRRSSHIPGSGQDISSIFSRRTSHIPGSGQDISSVLSRRGSHIPGNSQEGYLVSRRASHIPGTDQEMPSLRLRRSSHSLGNVQQNSPLHSRRGSHILRISDSFTSNIKDTPVLPQTVGSPIVHTPRTPKSVPHEVRFFEAIQEEA